MTASPLTFLVLALATWRISSIVTKELGPRSVFYKLRTGETLPHDLKELVGCLWCFSTWVGLAIMLFYLIVPTVTEWVCFPFALSGAAVIVEEKFIPFIGDYSE